MTALAIVLGLAWLTTLTALIYRAQVHDRRVDRLVALAAQATGRHTEQVNHLISLHTSERANTHPDLEALIRLVENLCQRIQAPEQAVIDHSIASPEGPQPQFIGGDDDDAYWAHQESKEELAERIEAEEARMAGLSG